MELRAFMKGKRDGMRMKRRFRVARWANDVGDLSLFSPKHLESEPKNPWDRADHGDCGGIPRDSISDPARTSLPSFPVEKAAPLDAELLVRFVSDLVFPHRLDAHLPISAHPRDRVGFWAAYTGGRGSRPQIPEHEAGGNPVPFPRWHCNRIPFLCDKIIPHPRLIHLIGRRMDCFGRVTPPVFARLPNPPSGLCNRPPPAAVSQERSSAAPGSIACLAFLFRIPWRPTKLSSASSSPC